MTTPSAPPPSTSHPSDEEGLSIDEQEALVEDAERRSLFTRANRKWWVIGGILIGAFVALCIVWGYSMAKDNIDYNTVGYTIDSDSQVTIQYQVERPVGRAVTCQLRAMNGGFLTVGSLDITVPADAPAQVQSKAVLRTTSRAVTGTVKVCSYADAD